VALWRLLSQYCVQLATTAEIVQWRRTLLRQDWPRSGKFSPSHKASEGLGTPGANCGINPNNRAVVERILSRPVAAGFRFCRAGPPPADRSRCGLLPGGFFAEWRADYQRRSHVDLGRPTFQNRLHLRRRIPLGRGPKYRLSSDGTAPRGISLQSPRSPDLLSMGRAGGREGRCQSEL